MRCNYAFQDYINTDLAINTLKIALKKEKHPKVILHSDQGVQFTSWDFVKFCKDNNITQSISKAAVLTIMLLWKDFTILSKATFIT